LDIVDGPGNLFIDERLPMIVIDEADLHLGGKMIIHDRAVHFF
jgi:hypothetical protein